MEQQLPTTYTWLLELGPLRTSYGELLYHAINIRDDEISNDVEKGLAMGIIALIEDAERRANGGEE